MEPRGLRNGRQTITLYSYGLDDMQRPHVYAPEQKSRFNRHNANGGRQRERMVRGAGAVEC